MNYNLNPTSTQIPKELIQANSSCKDTICLEKIWYLHRLYYLSKPTPYLSKIDEDSLYCKETGYKCTQEELNQTTRTISNLSQIGYTSIFDNNANALGLGTALETFVSDLNTFIIVAFITGPVVFIIAIKTMGRQKS